MATEVFYCLCPILFSQRGEVLDKKVLDRMLIQQREQSRLPSKHFWVVPKPKPRQNPVKPSAKPVEQRLSRLYGAHFAALDEAHPPEFCKKLSPISKISVTRNAETRFPVLPHETETARKRRHNSAKLVLQLDKKTGSPFYIFFGGK
jgi:hypothetical protein